MIKRIATLAVLVFVAASWSTSPSEGHGAGYPPPPPPPPPPPDGGGGGGGGSGGGSGDGSGGGGGDWEPPPQGGGGYSGPATPGPKGPAAPRPARGGARPTPGPSGPAAPKAGSSPAATQTSRGYDLSTWDWWWVYNRDPYLDLKARVLAGGTETGSDDFFLGHNTRVVREGNAPSETTMNTVVGPALQRAVEAESSDRVLCDSMIALAKLHPGYVPVGGTTMMEMFSRHLDHPNQKVVESAVVALGMMGEPACASVLCDIAEDTPAARKMLGRDKVPGRTRPLAALAVGMVGRRCDREDVRRYIVFRLSSILEGDEQAAPDLHVGCVTSLGLTPLSPMRGVIEAGMSLAPSSSHEGQVTFLAEILKDRDRDRFVRAHVPKALGLLVRDTDGAAKEIAAAAMLDVLKSRKKDRRLVRHGVAESLGLVGDCDRDPLDVEIRKALRTSVRDGDAFQRQLTVIAIALVSSRGGAGAGTPFEGLADERAYLIKQLSDGQSRLRPWAALALGVQAHHILKQGQAVAPEVTNALRQTMAKVKSPEDVGAWCTALGLCGDPEAAPDLHARLEKLSGDLPLGRVAIALGLLGDPEALAPLKQIVAESTFRPELLRESAIGLALLGDKQVIDDLIEVLATRDSMAVKSAAVTALGFVADRRAIDPLIKLLEDEEQQELTRSFAAIAVGVVCESDRLPWPALYMNHFNYEAATETLISRTGTGILNLR